jgi:hypothetical protein
MPSWVGTVIATICMLTFFRSPTGGLSDPRPRRRLDPAEPEHDALLELLHDLQ